MSYVNDALPGNPFAENFATLTADQSALFAIAYEVRTLTLAVTEQTYVQNNGQPEGNELRKRLGFYLSEGEL